MKSNSFLKHSACCLAAVFVLGACTNQSTAVTHRGPAATAASNSGRIPTADGRNAQYQPGNAIGGANGPEYAVRTGSRIPQDQNRRGYITDSPDNTYVIDQNDDRLQNAQEPSEALRLVPGLSVRGNH